MTRFKTISSASGLIAALSMAATPVSAAELPQLASPQLASQGTVPVAQNWEPGNEVAERYRRYRHRGYRHHRRVDAGDVLAGVLIIGGIAAIASAGSKKRDRNPPRYNQRISDADRNIDRAVNSCLRQIERDVRVEEVNTVNRTGNGWDIAGTLYNGDGFNCRTDNNGRVDGISYGGRSASVNYGQTTDRQHSDDRYAAAWDRVEGQGRTAQVAPQQPTGPQPAYPGGPLPGDEGYEDGRLGG